MRAHHNQPEYSVSELSGALKRTVEDTFGHVRVRGELSKVSINERSGHGYMDLKDDKAVLNAVCWRGTLSKLAVRPEMGLEVIVTGRLTTYPGSSRYQIVIEAMEVAGEGALMAMLEKRKKALAAEGLFDADRKQTLPFLPRRIGVVTSPTGAVIRDILHRIRDRFPTHVVLWPVAVQGDAAAAQIAAAIDGFNALPADHPLRPDMLIVARGGGSLEDLWCFNEEMVVRAAARSALPLISAVGHETDTTLIDYAADQRAPTPTGAAEMAVPVREALQTQCDEAQARLQRALRRMLESRSQQLDVAGERLGGVARLFRRTEERCNDMALRLSNALPRLLRHKGQQLASARLSPALLRARLQQETATLAQHWRGLHASYLRRIERHEERLARLASTLAAISPLAVLKRGYALVYDGAGNVIRSAKAAAPASIQFHDGSVFLQRRTPGKKQAAPATHKGKKASVNQGDLF
jgi:exodeoxyribonuclease VII large subunit